MKIIFYHLIILIMFFLSTHFAQSQNVVVVEPDEGINIGGLNDAINSAADPANTIFELRRGGFYYLNGSISHEGYTLHIRAEEGDGPRPVLQPAVDDLGAAAPPIETGGSLILEGIYIQGRDELGVYTNRQIIITGDNNRIIFENTFHDYARQSIVRLTTLDNYVSFNNSIIRNSLRIENPGNGRVIDTRSNPQDSLIIKNSTIYNNGSALIRIAGAFVKYIEIDHNTLWAVEFNGGIDLETTLEAKVTNNIFQNFGYRASSIQHDPLFWVDSLFTIGEFTDADRSFDLSNNNWYMDPAIGDIIEEFGSDTLYTFDAEDEEQLDTLFYEWEMRENIFADTELIEDGTLLPPPILSFIENGQVDTTNIFREKLEFDNAPPLNLEYWEFYTVNNYQIRELDPPNPWADEDPTYYGETTENPYTFNYNANSRSATASESGGPLGAPRWTTYGETSIEDQPLLPSNQVNTYPNPFTDQVTFQVFSEDHKQVRFEIFDLLGKIVMTSETPLQQGNNEITLSMDQLTESGIYLYKVETLNAGNNVVIASGKFMKK
ncbi:MAG: T9SS type A sorting domain-containing protein [Bacteroidales bacterium]